MSRHAIAIGLLLICLTASAFPSEEGTAISPSSTSPSLADAVRAQTSWDTIQGVSPGTRCRVSLKGGSTVTGALKEWTPERLVIANSKGKLIDCPRADVGRVDTLSPGSRRNRVLTAGLTAFGIGALFGYAAGTYLVNDSNAGSGTRVGVGAMMGGVWGGAAAGLAAIPRAERATLVYRSR